MTVEIISDCPRAQQKWIYKGRILGDDVSIRDAGIGEGDTVIIMKTAAATQTSSSAGVSRSAPSLGVGMAPPMSMSQPMRVSTERFDAAMLELLQNPDIAVQGAVGILLKIVANVGMHPMEEKYRRLSRTNAAFSKKVGSLAGGSNCMMALGFSLEGDEWVLTPSAQAWENLMACKGKLERFAHKLNQTLGSEKTAATPAAAPTIPAAAPAVAATSSPPVPPVDPANLILMQQLLHTMQQQQQQQQQQTASGSTTAQESNVSAANDEPQEKREE
jgi:hypothetical protein